MFRIISTGNSIPYSFPVDPNAEFEPGQIGQLGLLGNQIVCGVSDGSAPFGIIDDIKKNAFSDVSVDEAVIAAVPVQLRGTVGSRTVSLADISVALDNAAIYESYFVSRDLDVVLNARNGVITIPAGTELNYSMTGAGTPDAFRTVVGYSYQIPNVMGDDSTAASGQLTIWFERMIAETSMFETNRRYAINAPLFVSTAGLLTTVPPRSDYPSVGFVVAPPTALYGSLQFVWF